MDFHVSATSGVLGRDRFNDWLKALHKTKVGPSRSISVIPLSLKNSSFYPSSVNRCDAVRIDEAFV